MSREIHFVGIGGIGMSALARYFLSQGFLVTGSDEGKSPLVDELQEEGVKIFSKHNAQNLSENAEMLVYSEAVPKENTERMRAKEKNIPQKSYFAALGEISKQKYTVAICGTHGKSTTTAMTGLALEAAEADPLIILGTRIFEWKGKNIRLPESEASEVFAVESCEYHHSFLHLSPKIIVVTNIEPDHLDFFGTEENYYKAFEEFGLKLTEEHFLIADFTKPKIQEIFSKCKAKKIKSRDFIDKVPEMAIPGRHNIHNASRVLALFSVLGLPLEKGKAALQKFSGTWRRFEKKGERNGVLVYDDYAHHPTEIKATLSAFREKFPEKKIWAIFQPHQYSRTREFLQDFGESFLGANEVLIPNIYRVRDTEEDVRSVSAEILVERIKRHGENVRHTKNFEATIKLLKSEVREGDIVLTMGAGPVYQVADGFLG